MMGEDLSDLDEVSLSNLITIEKNKEKNQDSDLSFPVKETKPKKANKQNVKVPEESPQPAAVEETDQDASQNVTTVELKKISEHPHIPDGYFQKFYQRNSQRRLMLQAEPQNIYKAVLDQKAETRKALRPNLPGVFASLYKSNYKPDYMLSLGERLESRPPVYSYLDGPSPTTYRPGNKPLYERNAPSYTFGAREAEKTGGGRRAWGRPFMRSNTPFNYKADYERKWPTPLDYENPTTVATRQTVRRTFPSYSFGKKLQAHEWSKKGVPSANHYYPEVPALRVRTTAPAFTMSSRLRERTKMNVPPPDQYILDLRKKGPFYSFEMTERFRKRHETGPFCAT